MSIIAIANQKGGVGKTTTAVNVAARLIDAGMRVLLIDLDPQANATYHLGLTLPDDSHAMTVYNVLKTPRLLKEAIMSHDGLDVLPASIDLSGAEIELASEAGREHILKRALKPVKDDYNYILIDCPPSLGLLTLNALTAADRVWITVQTEALPLHGLAKLLQTIEIVQDRLNPDLQIAGVLCTRFNAQRNLDSAVVEKVEAKFKGKVFNTRIRQNVSLAEAPSHGKTIFEYAPSSTGAEDYQDLVKEIIKRR